MPIRRRHPSQLCENASGLRYLSAAHWSGKSTDALDTRMRARRGDNRILERATVIIVDLGELEVVLHDKPKPTIGTQSLQASAEFRVMRSRCDYR